MTWKPVPALFATLLLLTGTEVLAEEISFNDAIITLAGKTWSGTNDQGSKFWFWHDGGPEEGKFKAKFGSRGKVQTGTWKQEPGRICWLWQRNQNKFCYTKFDLHGDTLKMTRSDGVIHRGNIAEGNTEGM